MDNTIIMAASQGGIISSMTDWLVSLMSQMGGIGVAVAVFLENLFPPLPSEVILPLAGVTASQGKMGLVEAIVWATAGSLIGALVLYAIAAAIDHQEGRAHAGQPDQRHRDQGDRHQQHDRAPHEQAGNRQVHVESPSGKDPGQQRGHTPSTSIRGRKTTRTTPFHPSFNRLRKSPPTSLAGVMLA